MTQKQEILTYMKDHKKSGITSLNAFKMFGVTRLSAVIFKLKKDGHIITKKLETVKNRYGKTCTVARYLLEDE